MRFLSDPAYGIALYAQDNGPARADWLHYGGTQLSLALQCSRSDQYHQRQESPPGLDLSNRRLRGESPLHAHRC